MIFRLCSKRKATKIANDIKNLGETGPTRLNARLDDIIRDEKAKSDADVQAKVDACLELVHS